MPFCAKTIQDDSLYRCAKFCFEIARPVLEFLPKTRESQAILANLLSERIAKSEESFSIDANFLVDRIGCTDANLIGQWKGAPTDLAWLMVHEQLSNYFCQFVIDNWNAEVFLIHHVPRSGGTSVCEVVRKQSFFVAYPQTNFRIMVQSSGLLGFGLQLVEFEELAHPDRIYVGGHFNLPEMLAKLGRGNVQCRGISLSRSPVASMSSAIRYVWIMVEQSDLNWTRTYPSLDPMQLSAVRDATTLSEDPASLTAMRDIVGTITRAPEFQENFGDLLSKYYYNQDVGDVFALQRLFADHPDLAPCVDAVRDEDLICWQLRINGPMPRLSNALFPHRYLERAFGSDEAFHAAIASAALRSSEIYGALCVMRALSARG